MTRSRAALVCSLVFLAFVSLTVGASAKPSAPTLSVSFGQVSVAGGTVAYGTPYVVSGCGYSSGSGVTIVVHSPEAISFAGQMPDASGCISVSNFSTQGAGGYKVDAYQQVHNRSQLVASTSFTLS